MKVEEEFSYTVTLILLWCSSYLAIARITSEISSVIGSISMPLGLDYIWYAFSLALSRILPLCCVFTTISIGVKLSFNSLYLFWWSDTWSDWSFIMDLAVPAVPDGLFVCLELNSFPPLFLEKPVVEFSFSSLFEKWLVLRAPLKKLW